MKTLIDKLLKITEEIEPLHKNGTNEKSKYNYVTEQDVLMAVKPLLIKHGVYLKMDVVHPLNLSDVRSELMGIAVKYKFICRDTMETLEYDWMGAGWDDMDKGLYKAITGALKYFLIKNLLIETGENDDPEFDGKKPWVKQDKEKLSDKAKKQEPIPEMTDPQIDARQKEREAKEEKVRAAEATAKPDDMLEGLGKAKENMKKVLDATPKETVAPKPKKDYPAWFDIECHVGKTIGALGVRLGELNRMQIKELLEKEGKWNKGTPEDLKLKPAIYEAAEHWHKITGDDAELCAARNELGKALTKAGVDLDKVAAFAAEQGWLPCKMKFELIPEARAAELLLEIETVIELFKTK